MLTEAEFRDQVFDAYGHLYDLVYLRTHPLIDLLLPDPSLSGRDKAWQLHHVLLGVIGELKPEPQVPVHSRQWRRHQLMVLRYVKALDPKVVADQLTVSRRHFYREHHIAIETIADILRDRHVTQPPEPSRMSQAVQDQASLDRLSLLRLEAARMAQADRYARIDGVIEGVLPLLEEMWHQHGLDIHLALQASLPGISMDRESLRQLLLGMLGYLSERTHQATIGLGAQLEESDQGPTIRLSIRVRPSATAQLTDRAIDEGRLATFEEMATLSDAHLTVLRAGQSVVGFDVVLPVAERTVLVIDDNEDLLELFSRYLASHHYRVVTAENAAKALELARRVQPHAITLDLMMPRQDGWDVLQTLLNQPETCHIPVLVCSILQQKELALSLGATAFLEKPVTEPVLLAALRAIEEV
jgi:CheY-like chemotaxis protein